MSTARPPVITLSGSPRFKAAGKRVRDLSREFPGRSEADRRYAPRAG